MKKILYIIFEIIVICAVIVLSIYLYKLDKDKIKIIDVTDKVPFQEVDIYDNVDRISENLPIISTTESLYNFSMKIVESTYSKEKYKDELRVNSLDNCMIDLINNKTDIVIANIPSNNIFNMISDLKVEVKFEVIAYVPLVFFTNEKNPVDNVNIYELVQEYNLENSKYGKYIVKSSDGVYNVFSEVCKNINKNNVKEVEIIDEIKEILTNKINIRLLI